MVLWGSDNIKSDGGPIAQALAADRRDPAFRRLWPPVGRGPDPAVRTGPPAHRRGDDAVGHFPRPAAAANPLLAEAALKAATADEPEAQNFIRAHALATAQELGCDLETAALRVYSNAEGAYGSNVNALVDSSTFGDEDELADAYQTRKGFAYGVNGKPMAQPSC